ncbi:MAG: HEAT repeat domain-containing protein [Candidatus Binataceae bacterium]|nr:HEAT repeat domain-containing protein [Candidatus Binataceae bacterium]
MNKLIVAAASFLVFSCLSFAEAQTTVPDPGLLSGDWSVKHAKSLNAESRDAVWKFVNNLWGNSDLSPPNGKLCDFQFADLRHSGELSLVIGDDYGGTAECNNVDIFDKSGTGFEYYWFSQTGPSYYDEIDDLARDGNQELVVDRPFDSGGIDHCTATWPAIYAWTGTGYSDVSSNFKSYYEEQLASLQKEIATAEAQDQAGNGAVPQSRQSAAESPALASPQVKNGPGVTGIVTPRHSSGSLETPALSDSATSEEPIEASEIMCLKAEAYKIERFLGVSRDAGMRDAIEWAKSDDPVDREFAANALAGIGTAEAIEDLKTLSSDPDRNVALGAKADLALVKTPVATYPMIQGELLTPNVGNPPAK